LETFEEYINRNSQTICLKIVHAKKEIFNFKVAVCHFCAWPAFEGLRTHIKSVHEGKASRV